MKPLLAIALLALPAIAQADWSHDPSGVSLPDSVGAMTKGEERDLSNGAKLDVMIQYGAGTEPATVYVYRGSHPNPALWFERTRRAMRDNVGTFDESAAPRPITVGGAPAPNGLREEFTLTGAGVKGSFKATSVALVQYGEWMVKARITSATLDAAGVAAKMDALLGALRFKTPPPAPLPLSLPAACAAPATFAGKPKVDPDSIVSAALVGGTVNNETRGIGGLAAKPGDWCRDEVGDLGKIVTLYRRNDGGAWTAFLGDAGMSASAIRVDLSKGTGAGVYFTRTGTTKLALTYDALPDVKTGLASVMPLLSGQGKALATFGTGAK